MREFGLLPDHSPTFARIGDTLVIGAFIKTLLPSKSSLDIFATALFRSGTISKTWTTTIALNYVDF